MNRYFWLLNSLYEFVFHNLRDFSVAHLRDFLCSDGNIFATCQFCFVVPGMLELTMETFILNSA